MQSCQPHTILKFYQPKQPIKILLLIGLFILASGFAVGACFAGENDGSVSAQTAITGEWNAKVFDDKQRSDRDDEEDWNQINKPDSIHINLSRRTNRGENNFGSSIQYSDFEGLTRDVVLGANPHVAFHLTREAGKIDFQGSFQNGRGAGDFTFTPNQTFVGGMRDRGFAAMTEDQMFAATTLNVTTRAVDELRGAGFKLNLDDVFKAVIFKITPQFIAEMNSIGFKNLDMEDLVKARIFKINPQFAREVASLGFADEPMESLVKMRIFKITPEFILEIRGTGLNNLDVEDFVKFKIHGVTADFIKQARSNGYAGNEPEDFVRMRIRGMAKLD